MPIGEFIGEVLLRGIFEIILSAIAYYTGAMVLWILTLGRIRLAPLSSIDSSNRKKNRWTDWSIWLHQGGRQKALKAEYTCLVGMLAWIAIGFGIYSVTREVDQAAKSAAYSCPSSLGTEIGRPSFAANAH